VSRFLTLLALLLAALVLGAGAALAQETPAADIPAQQLIEAARAALAQGQPEDAEFLIEGLVPDEETIDDLDFLRGSIALQRGDWAAAIERFRAMLARNPDLPRVRLDLAFAYFQDGKDRRAAYHFRVALGSKQLPPVARARALAFLDSIRRRKAWSLSGSLAVAPDTNINAATSAQQITLYGLPAQLSDDARQTSGVGLHASVLGAYEWPVGEAVKLRTALGVQTRTYDTSAYNQQVVSLQAGPRLLFRAFDVLPEVTTRQRWLGSDAYSRTVGLQVSGNWLLAPTWRLSAALSEEWVAYESFLGDGRIRSGQVGIAHALGRATALQGSAVVVREVLDEAAQSWREYGIEVAVSREFPRGFVLGGGPTWRWRRYDAPTPTFGAAARRDRTFAGWLSVSNRYVQLFGFMPGVTLRYERRDSNLALYDYERTVGEFSLAASF